MLGGSLGNDELYESRSQFSIGICQSPEFLNPTMETPDQLINVERKPTPVMEPVFVIRLRLGTSPSNIATRITVNESTSKDLIEPFVATKPSSRRCLETC